jgi:DNA relaxase NicK
MRIHWFAFTFFGDRQEFDAIYKEFFYPTFGDYVEQEYGGRGYRIIATTAIGIKLYFDPVSKSDKGNHFHVEIPGTACDCLIPDVFRELMTYLTFSRWVKGVLQSEMFSVKRLDMAFDYMPFTPEEWLIGITGSNVVTLAKRDKIRITNSPFALRENGEQGCMTVYLGTNESDRMIRVYNQRGYTRFEFQMRDERAHLVAMDVLLSSYTKWHKKAISHVVQFVNFTENIPDWWTTFIKSEQSAELIISSSRVVSLRKTERWHEKQIAPSLSVIAEVEGWEYIENLVENGKKRDRSRYAPILQLKEGDK